MDPNLQKLTKARAALILSQPFFGALALRLKVVGDTGIATMATDGVEIRYNPSFVADLPMPELTAVVAHEVMHCASAHHARRGGRDPGDWNRAADFAINGLLAEAGFKLPATALLDRRFAGKSAEEIYAEIHRPQPSGGASRQPQPASDPGGCGAVIDAPSPSGSGAASPADLAAAEREWKVATIQAAQAAKAQGKLPGGLERLLDEIRHPKADWRELLRRFVSATMSSDYRWVPPNRRFVGMGLYLPSLAPDRVGELVVAVDTSGSINQDLLAQFAGEITAIAEDVRPEAINVLYCDAAIRGEPQRFDPGDEVTLEARGGGGTDFRPPFAWVEEQGINPACLIYLTDLRCNRWPEDPGYPVIWASTTDREAMFGTTVHLRDTEQQTWT